MLWPRRSPGRGSPSQPLEVLGEVAGFDKGRDVGLQALKIRVVEDVDGGVLHGSVHPLGLAVDPGVIEQGQLSPCGSRQTARAWTGSRRLWAAERCRDA